MRYYIKFFGLAMMTSTLVHCGKKSSDSGSGSSGDISKPVNALSLVFNSLQSAAAGTAALSKSTSLVAGEVELKETMCTEHAEPLALSTDAASDKDNSGRLQTSHARYALNDLYCKMQINTKAPDSFVGALFSVKLYLCVMGDLIFDGTERTVTVTKAKMTECLADYSEADKNDILSGFTDTTGKVTASLPSHSSWSFGDKAGGWGGQVKFAITFGSEESSFNILLKDDAQASGVAISSGSGRSVAVDNYLAIVDKTNSALYYEALFQRIRTPDGSSSNGWNRHSRVYLKGTFDSSYNVTSVSDVQGVYSDISINAGSTNATSSTSPVQDGTVWTAKGSENGGIKTHMYKLACTGSSSPLTCGNVNLKASWTATAGDGACNGATSGTTCTVTGNPITADADTQFFSEASNSKYVNGEDWLKSVAIPTYTKVTFDMTQK